MERKTQFKLTKWDATGATPWFLSLLFPLCFAAFIRLFFPEDPLFPPLSLIVTSILLLACLAGLLRGPSLEVDAEHNLLRYAGRRYLLSDVGLVRVAPRDDSTDKLVKSYVIELRLRGEPMRLFDDRPLADARMAKVGPIADVLNDAVFVRSELDGAPAAISTGVDEGPYRTTTEGARP